MSISVREALKLIAQNVANPKFKILDVRTLPQRNALHIPNSDHIPLDQLPQSLNNFQKDNTYLIYCRSGKRSLNATQILNQSGFKAINMEGGILQWQQVTTEGSGESKEKTEEVGKDSNKSSWCNLI